jgi:hypothetical protein
MTAYGLYLVAASGNTYTIGASYTFHQLGTRISITLQFHNDYGYLEKLNAFDSIMNIGIISNTGNVYTPIF